MNTTRNIRTRRNPNGFTLMELLIVIAIILILMLMAIPTVGTLKKKANHTSAIQSLRAITQAELQYASSYPTNGYACSLASLGGDKSTGPPTAAAAQMLPQELASGDKAGYIFTITNCTKVTVNNSDRITGYQINAVPETVGKTGDVGYCEDESATLKQDPTGGTNCTQIVQ